MAIWNRFSTILFGGAIGAAARDAVAAQLEVARQVAWRSNPHRILEVDVLAQLVAEGLVTETAVTEIVRRNGHPTENLHALVELHLAAPGLADLMAGRRRGIASGGTEGLSVAEFEDGLGKLKIHPEFRPLLADLLDIKLSPEVVATAIVRGLLKDPGILPVGPPTEPGDVPSFPVFNIDAVKEALAGGITLERLKVMVGIFGRPMSPEGAAQAFWRKLILRQDYYRAVAESDVRNEWRDAILEASRFILSPQDAAGLRLRGWLTKDESDAIGALHGATPETMQGLYLDRGRPPSTRQIRLGFARGAKVAGFPWTLDEAIAHGVQQSDVRTEYIDIEREASWSYPSPFEMRALLQAGAYTAAEGTQQYIEMGRKPEAAKKIAEFWAGSKGTAAQPLVTRARSRLYTVAHNEYLSGSISELTAREVLAGIGASQAEQDGVIATWNVENQIARLELTPAQIKKAYKKGLWTLAEATTVLEERGMYPGDVDTFLNE